MDSGASSHMVNDLSYLHAARELSPQVRVVLGNGDSVYASHIGLVKLTDHIRLKDVLFVKGLHENLLSTTAACKTEGIEARQAKDRY